MSVRTVGVGLLVACVAIQFVPVSRDNPPVESEVPATAAVRSILRTSCYDCHSNETRWPWYAHVAPVSWLVADDVHHAREHMNFSTWARYDARKQAKHLEEAWEEIEEGEMPLFYYVWLHPEAELSAGDRIVLRDWTGGGDDD
jgi:hypothetical protein